MPRVSPLIGSGPVGHNPHNDETKFDLAVPGQVIWGDLMNDYSGKNMSQTDSERDEVDCRYLDDAGRCRHKRMDRLTVEDPKRECIAHFNSGTSCIFYEKGVWVTLDKK